MNYEFFSNAQKYNKERGKEQDNKSKKETQYAVAVSIYHILTRVIKLITSSLAETQDLWSANQIVKISFVY